VDGGGEVSERSVAVLPFVNMSNDQENEYFSDGLTETLLHKLTQMEGLQVAARTSSFASRAPAPIFARSLQRLRWRTCSKAACNDPATRSASLRS
jgi:TolB-like protein